MGAPDVPVHRRSDSAVVDSLVQRVASGDSPAFELLYDEIANTVFSIVRRVLTDSAHAEEVTQEVLLEIWKTAERFDPARGAAVSWIRTISHRRAVDRVRAAQSTRERDTRNASRAHVPAHDCVFDEVARRRDHAEVRGHLQRLTPAQRQSVLLAYYGGYTHREVADLLGLPLGTVKTRLRQSILNLRQHMTGS